MYFSFSVNMGYLYGAPVYLQSGKGLIIIILSAITAIILKWRQEHITMLQVPVKADIIIGPSANVYQTLMLLKWPIFFIPSIFVQLHLSLPAPLLFQLFLLVLFLKSSHFNFCLEMFNHFLCVLLNLPAIAGDLVYLLI